jgi:hypothetical protein
MNRGILTITKPEYDELMKNFHVNNYSNTPLFSKLTSVSQLGEITEVEILLSSDELEIILDDIGFVDININPLLNSVITKISQKLNSFN